MNEYHAQRTNQVTDLERSHMERVCRLAGECMVLLENDGTLPLPGAEKIALYGNGARATVKGGTGSGEVNSRFVVNIEEGLEAAGFTVTTKGWLDAQQQATREEYDRYWARLVQRAEQVHTEPVFLSWSEPFVARDVVSVTEQMVAESQTDTAVYVLARNSGEGADRHNEPGDYQLLPGEREALAVLGRSYRKVIVLLNVGGVVDAAALREIPGIGAVVLISQSGNMTGHIVADLLLNRVTPSGRLADTWARRYEDYPSSATFSHNNGDCHEEFYTEGIFVGYRYFDTFGVEPLYPFGYGKSYTSFAQEVLELGADEKQVRLRVRVTNTGSTFGGRQVVQVYDSAPAGKLEKPYQVLVAFAKTRYLEPGTAQELEIVFPLTRLESYDPDRAAYVLEAGSYLIRVGSHSRDTRIAAVLELDRDAVTRQVKNICPLDVPLEELSAAGATPYGYPEEAAQRAAAPVIRLSGERVPRVTVTYGDLPEPLPVPDTDHVITMEEVRAGRYSMEQLVAQLTVEEMADLCVGTGREAQAEGIGVIGSASQTVPGAAGDTSVLLGYRGVRNMVNADGPAGLRLQPCYRTDAQGNLVPGGEIMGNQVAPMPPKREGEVNHYQDCTAIPIATLLASSWDLELIEDMGDLVGAEMEQFGVQVWLAPGMNIHRNPLCGRNFEYYSEDPLLSGLCAAADVRGVQRHPGVGACIKHFFANNQEDNRMAVNEHIGERALREIYLRNFAVTIAHSNPMCLMTSYNLVNGVHTANSYDAITGFAREECGFSGYVMTDWFTSHQGMTDLMAVPGAKYPCSSSPMCVYAGNDVQMPGCEKNISDIVRAVTQRSLPLGLLQRCCLRLLLVDLQCSCYENSAPYRRL